MHETSHVSQGSVFLFHLWVICPFQWSVCQTCLLFENEKSWVILQVYKCFLWQCSSNDFRPEGCCVGPNASLDPMLSMDIILMAGPGPVTQWDTCLTCKLVSRRSLVWYSGLAPFFVEFDHKIFPMIILFLLLIQERQLLAKKTD